MLPRDAQQELRDAHKVTICDRYADGLVSKFALQFGGKKLADDPVAGARAPGNDVATPRVVKAALLRAGSGEEAMRAAGLS